MKISETVIEWRQPNEAIRQGADYISIDSEGKLWANQTSNHTMGWAYASDLKHYLKQPKEVIVKRTDPEVKL